MNKIAHAREIDDFIEPLRRLPAGQPEHGRVDAHIFRAGQIRMKAGAQLQQRRHPAVHLDASGIRQRQSAGQIQQRAFARAVGAHQSQTVPLRNLERRRPSTLPAAPPGRDETAPPRAGAAAAGPL